MADVRRPPASDPECLAALGELVAFLDGELAPAEAEAVAAHLARCASCGAERRALEATWAALDVLTPLEPRPAWTERVERAALRGEPRRSAARLVRRGGWRAAAALAAALPLAAGLGWLATRPGPEAGAVTLRPDAPAPRTAPAASPEVVPPRSESERAEGRHEVEPRSPALDLEPVGDEEAWEEELGPDELSDEELEALDAELPLAPPGELAGLAPEELDVIRNLELLVLLEAGEELDVLEALDLLEQLEEEELDES